MSNNTAEEPTTVEQPETLKRVMGPKLLLLFIVGDILGTGVYALTGKVAGEVGGAGWLPVIIAFSVAMVTAFSYLELVTKYPNAAGAALYAHKAFGIHFVTFLVAFAVLSSGITSASTASNVFAANMIAGFGWNLPATGTMWIALGFLAIVAAINLRGVGESVWFNVVLTIIELSGLLLVIFVGLFALTSGDADFSRVLIFETADDKSIFLAVTAATSLAFFSMVGFEDSVNMVEETKDPIRVFPKIMITGLGITGLIYVLVSVVAVAAVPIGVLAESETPLLDVVKAGAPHLPIDEIFPFMTMFAVANSALINMLMASRLLYGMAKQNVLPPVFAKVLKRRRSPWVSIIFTTIIAFALIIAVTSLLPETVTASLGGTTSLLLLTVFAVVNVAVLVLRKKPVAHEHFKAPKYLPWVGLVACLFLVGPWARMSDLIQYQIALALVGIGVVLWVITWLWNRSVTGASTKFRNPEDLV